MFSGSIRGRFRPIWLRLVPWAGRGRQPWTGSRRGSSLVEGVLGASDGPGECRAARLEFGVPARAPFPGGRIGRPEAPLPDRRPYWPLRHQPNVQESPKSPLEHAHRGDPDRGSSQHRRCRHVVRLKPSASARALLRGLTIPAVRSASPACSTASGPAGLLRRRSLLRPFGFRARAPLPERPSSTTSGGTSSPAARRSS